MSKNNIEFKFVSIYVIGKKGNLSVGAPFCRGCPNKTIQILEKERKKGPTLSLDDLNTFNKINTINSYNEFSNLYDKLTSVIKAKQLGKNEDKDLMNKLNSLYKRIIKSLNVEQKEDFEKNWKKLYEMAMNGIHNYQIGTAGIKK